MGLLAGVARRMTNLQSVPVIDTTFTSLFGSGSLFGIPSLVIWTALAVSVGHYAYRETRFGARVLATGDNPDAARAAGIKVDRLRLKVLILGSHARLSPACSIWGESKVRATPLARQIFLRSLPLLSWVAHGSTAALARFSAR